MRCVVVGAGAWGLPAAAELATRGHRVVLVDRYGVANRLGSSPGPTRLWRLTHPDRVRVRLARRSVEAMDRLAVGWGEPVYLRRGLLWRDDGFVAQLASALAAEGVPHEEVAAADVGRFLPGLRPDGRDAVWQADAGPVLAAVSMRAQAARFAAAGGEALFGRMVHEVRTTANGVRVACDGRDLDADVVVLATGPGAGPLLASLGVDLPLRPRVEQVVHLGGPDDLPCLVEGPVDGQPALYAMPTPGVGYKIGIDRKLRDLAWPGDTDRTPDPDVTAEIVARVRRDMAALDPEPIDAQVCTWTLAPDRRFVIDTLAGGVVVACGDSGEGFKFSALLGTVLADLAEGGTPDADIATFGLHRFAAAGPGGEPRVLGR